jgi:hypothetical protein
MNNPRKNWDSNIWLYAKHHYFETDMVEDLKVIIGDRCGLYPQHVQVENIALILLGIVGPLLRNSGNPQHFFEDFILGLDPDEAWKVSHGKADDDFHRRLIAKCLSVIRLAPVVRHEPLIGDVWMQFDDPDPTLLPLSRPEDGNLDLAFIAHRQYRVNKSICFKDLPLGGRSVEAILAEMRERFDYVEQS